MKRKFLDFIQKHEIKFIILIFVSFLYLMYNLLSDKMVLFLL